MLHEHFMNPKYPRWVKYLAGFMIIFWLLFGLLVLYFAFYMLYISVIQF